MPLYHRGNFTQEADLVRGICGAHGGYETAEVPDVRIIGGGGGGGCMGGQGKKRTVCFLDDLRAFGINADQWTTAVSRTRGNGAGRRNKGRNVSRRNGSLQRIPEHDGKC